MLPKPCASLFLDIYNFIRISLSSDLIEVLDSLLLARLVGNPVYPQPKFSEKDYLFTRN
jgi:hypothetical protein